MPFPLYANSRLFVLWDEVKRGLGYWGLGADMNIPPAKVSLEIVDSCKSC